MIYNHPIGRKNATNIYHLYRQKSPVFSTHHWHPEFFFSTPRFSSNPVRFALSYGQLLNRVLKMSFQRDRPKPPEDPPDGRNLGIHVFSSKRVVNGPNEITPPKKVGKKWECQKSMSSNKWIKTHPKKSGKNMRSNGLDLFSFVFFKDEA